MCGRLRPLRGDQVPHPRLLISLRLRQLCVRLWLRLRRCLLPPTYAAATALLLLLQFRRLLLRHCLLSPTYTAPTAPQQCGGERSNELGDQCSSVGLC